MLGEETKRTLRTPKQGLALLVANSYREYVARTCSTNWTMRFCHDGVSLAQIPELALIRLYERRFELREDGDSAARTTRLDSRSKGNMWSLAKKYKLVRDGNTVSITCTHLK